MQMDTNLKLYKLFLDKVGEEATTELVHALDNAREKDLKELASKKDVMEVRLEIKETKSEIIKWVFLFILGQTATLIAVIKLL